MALAYGRLQSNEPQLPDLSVDEDAETRRRGELAYVIALQHERNEMYDRLMHHSHNYEMGMRHSTAARTVDHLREQVAAEGAEYDAFCERVRAAQQAYRERWERRYSTAEAAAELGVSERRVRALAAARNIGTRTGRDWMFSRANVDAMRERTPGRPPKKA